MLAKYVLINLIATSFLYMTNNKTYLLDGFSMKIPKNIYKE